jgi:hypothetical protein
MQTTESVLFADDRKFVSPEVYDAFFTVVERLEATLERETAALAAQKHGEIATFTRQKRQSFLELHRIMQSLEQTIPSQDIIARLMTFRRKLEANDAMLRRQMRAVQEVTDIIVRVIQDVESDGTYSRGYGHSDWNAV